MRIFLCRKLYNVSLICKVPLKVCEKLGCSKLLPMFGNRCVSCYCLPCYFLCVYHKLPDILNTSQLNTLLTMCTVSDQTVKYFINCVL